MPSADDRAGMVCPPVRINRKTEGLALGIVLLRPKAERRITSVRRAIVGQVPSGEHPRALVHVALGVEIDAHREQLHEFAGVVLLRVRLHVGVAVQPRHHRRILRDLDQEIPKVTQGVLAKQLVLPTQAVRIFGRFGAQRAAGAVRPDLTGDLAEPGREVVVPEEGHLLLQRSCTVDHPKQHALPGVGDALIWPKWAASGRTQESGDTDVVVDGVRHLLVVDQRIDRAG
jgi:hypothetical protein